MAMDRYRTAELPRSARWAPAAVTAGAGLALGRGGPGPGERRGGRLHVGRHLHRGAAEVLLRPVREGNRHPGPDRGRSGHRQDPRDGPGPGRRVGPGRRRGPDDAPPGRPTTCSSAPTSRSSRGATCSRRRRATGASGRSRTRTRSAGTARSFPAGRQPRTWKDFFDTKAFPGRRAMYGQPVPGARVRPPGRRRRAGRALSARRRPRLPVPREPEGRRQRLVQEPGPDPDAPPRGEVDMVEGFSGAADRPQEGRGRRRLDVRRAARGCSRSGSCRRAPRTARRPCG